MQQDLQHKITGKLKQVYETRLMKSTKRTKDKVNQRGSKKNYFIIIFYLKLRVNFNFLLKKSQR